MVSQFDMIAVYEFIKSAGEGPLRKMLNGTKMSPIHINLLLKIVRSCKSEEFGEHYEKMTYPKIKMNSDEIKLKEKFWMDVAEVCLAVGLVTPMKQAA